MDREKVIKGLEWLLENMVDPFNDFRFLNTTGPIVLANKPIIADAIALLKAQEPRVMTLEEVTEDRPDVVWFDDRHYKLTYPAFVSNGDVTGWVVSLSKGCYERHDNIDGYGREWRCWTSRPTNEQREATPWIS